MAVNVRIKSAGCATSIQHGITISLEDEITIPFKSLAGHTTMDVDRISFSWKWNSLLGQHTAVYVTVYGHLVSSRGARRTHSVTEHLAYAPEWIKDLEKTYRPDWSTLTPPWVEPPA